MIFNNIRLIIFIISFYINQYNCSINNVSSAFIYGQESLVREESYSLEKSNIVRRSVTNTKCKF
jgi:hypothetical protein